MSRKFAREALAIIAGAVEPRGLTAELAPGSKHRAILVEGPAIRQKFPISSTPRSASCQLTHIRQQTTRWLKQQGFA